MHGREQFHNLIFRTISVTTSTTLAMAILFALMVTLTQSVEAQTFKVLHTFTGGTDGAIPYAGLTLDQAGNLYGTTSQGGNPWGGNGTVFQLKRKSSNFVFNHLWSFDGIRDGSRPYARVIFGPNGTLYGTTHEGGSQGVGTVFNLAPQPKACKSALCTWTEPMVYSFGYGGPLLPGYGDLIFDQAGNIYGTTELFYAHYWYNGAVYELTPSGGGWTDNFLHIFMGDGSTPESGVIFDQSGNLYGTTSGGGADSGGTVYQLTPSGGSWTYSLVYSFSGGDDGVVPWAGLIFDPSGNLYGSTTGGGTGGGGTVFELIPSNGSWTLNTLYSFTSFTGAGPRGTLVMDGAGNLYGTTGNDGAYGYGTVFKLTPTPQPPWTYTSLHDFTGGSDGGNPYGNVAFDASGNLYGTTSNGGAYYVGVVWEITP